MFDELRAAIIGARARERRPDALTAADALELATLGGARALGLEDGGRLARSRKAGRSHRSVPGRKPVPSLGRSCYGRRARRLPGASRRYSRVRQIPLRERRGVMARADRRRSQRTRPAAVTRRADVVIEDTMFFPKLRRNAKWVFLFLALVFALGFVGFGVGAGGVGIGDVLRGCGRRLRRALGLDMRAGEGQREPEDPPGLPRPGDRRAGASRRPTRRSRRSRATSRSGRGTPTLLRELAGALPRAGRRGAGRSTRSPRCAPLTSAPARPCSRRINLGGRPLDVDPVSNAVATLLLGRHPGRAEPRRSRRRRAPSRPTSRSRP